jgi:lipoprotein-anchoring transpeptidase ErfK/SrfK
MPRRRVAIYETVSVSACTAKTRSRVPSMQRLLVSAFVVLSAGAAAAQTASNSAPMTPPMVVMVPAQPPMRAALGGGFIEFLFGERGPQPRVASPPPDLYPARSQPTYINAPTQVDPMLEPPSTAQQMDSRYFRQEIAYAGKEAPGTIVIDTPNHFLYLVEHDGKAMRYGIGVGRPGFTWAGRHAISAKKEWPDWVPPKEMIERQPGLPHFMTGGPNNPLGARAMYLGSTLYRIHGSNEPWTIGQNVSSGCIRMRNVDVIDLYERVKVGTKVVVL